MKEVLSSRVLWTLHRFWAAPASCIQAWDYPKDTQEINLDGALLRLEMGINNPTREDLSRQSHQKTQIGNFQCVGLAPLQDAAYFDYRISHFYQTPPYLSRLGTGTEALDG